MRNRETMNVYVHCFVAVIIAIGNGVQVSGVSMHHSWKRWGIGNQTSGYFLRKADWMIFDNLECSKKQKSDVSFVSMFLFDCQKSRIFGNFWSTRLVFLVIEEV